MTKRPDAAYWIDKLQLTSHVEGGVFREVYRSELVIPRKSLPLFFQGDRPASTHIYFLLLDGQFSAFHRIASDEIWHFYSGDPLLVYEITHSGRLVMHRLGGNPDQAEFFFRLSVPVVGLLRPWPMAANMRWWAARWRRVLILPILSWLDGTFW